MNIYDPPLAYEGADAWQEYLRELQRNPVANRDEIQRTIEYIQKHFIEDGAS